MSKVSVSYKARVGVNDMPVGIRQRVGYFLLGLAQHVDPSRLYTVVQFVSDPVLPEQVRAECVAKGLTVTHNLFVSEVRQAAGEIALRKGLPELFNSEQNGG